MAKGKKKVGIGSDFEVITYQLSLMPIYINTERMKTEIGESVANDIQKKFAGFKKWAEGEIKKVK
jgi:hypothetical protein